MRSCAGRRLKPSNSIQVASTLGELLSIYRKRIMLIQHAKSNHVDGTTTALLKFDCLSARLTLRLIAAEADESMLRFIS
ncbi:hypothetical protein G7K_6522-t1 [Saitoella complicata NRRL Y-17804]|uniref:Uncharacterized protein n=1 Tax=Saitoella complicata (strain BCRC 22490 / CBS 7301 / JCM 7358 / NBRC 10748 / NRRL Y-17804) TaxID=698492 RepID=A0A0E9NRZ7_SAICN|nr:hypothetical protein G7K_6522-t1 [Saitoella complicata NRRL Y-17804]